MTDMITMYHPKTGQTATVSVRSFELVWSKKGWQPARTEPDPEPEQTPVDDPELED